MYVVQKVKMLPTRKIVQGLSVDTFVDSVTLWRLIEMKPHFQPYFSDKITSVAKQSLQHLPHSPYFTGTPCR